MKAREGWSWGFGGGEWLTILGSHWKSPALTATAAEAVKPGGGWEGLVLARVREVWHPGVTNGLAYRILERAEPPTQ